MRKRFLITTLVLTLSIFVVTACTGGFIPVTGGQPDLQATQNWLIIQAAQATGTQIAMETQVAQAVTQTLQAQNTSAPVIVTATPSPEQPTSTQEPTATQPAPTATLLPPTATVIVPTQTPVVVFVTPLPSATALPTATPLPCNAAAFVSDVTVPDGAVFTPGSTFTKIWRLRNVGTCTWNTNYDVVFYEGSSMNGPVSLDLPGSVAPDQVIDVPVTLTAPSNPGTYRSSWKLRSDSGVLFGLSGGQPFYTEIRVENPTSEYPYDFAAGFCSAQWSTSAGNLTCPGADNDSRGFVLRYERPQLENGQIDDELGLLTNPQMVNDGVIRGKYPSFRVETGHHFQSIIGCAYNASSCDVRFQLDYQIGDGSIQTLGTWTERYEEMTTVVDVDLSSLAGKDVKFILTVFANGGSNGDRALWLAPRITKR